MLSHDGDSHIHQKIEDRAFKVEASVKYQMLKKGWQQQIQIARSEESKNKSKSAYWMNYMTVQNTDHNLIKVFDSTSKTPKFYQIREKSKNRVELTVDSIGQNPQNILIESSNPLKVFGFSMNISQTYDVRGTMQEVKYLIELQRYKMRKRKNDSSLVQWQDRQLQLMKYDDWIGHKFVVLVFYG